ncbi:hypothetical protein PHMEG_00010260 [Phytophthora megakarya]|uniref:Uncharacterized protein n=1 Tax=Phytophthora megakarya TaxID=4795 RepID=A0A225WFH5_9STRA|nr:hypothetical protein PHMEG_00010260 [Phytophthora megakarya]
MIDNIARGAILHGIRTTEAELIYHERSADAIRSASTQCIFARHHKKIISDEEFAEILLDNVSHTRGEQFSKHYEVLAAPASQRSATSPDQVMNALRAESELDAKFDDSQRGQIVSSSQSGKQQGKGKKV